MQGPLEHPIHQQHDNGAEQQADDERLPPRCCPVPPPRAVHALTIGNGLPS